MFGILAPAGEKLETKYIEGRSVRCAVTSDPYPPTFYAVR